MSTVSAIAMAGYEFEGPFTDTSALRHQQGVYAILDRRSTGNWHVVDVGESEDVKTRVENHDRSDCWKRHQQGTLGVAVLYTTGWTAAQRRVIEGKVRHQYNPPCGER